MKPLLNNSKLKIEIQIEMKGYMCSKVAADCKNVTLK